MDFIEELRNLSARIENQKDVIQTEDFKTVGDDNRAESEVESI